MSKRLISRIFVVALSWVVLADHPAYAVDPKSEQAYIQCYQRLAKIVSDRTPETSASVVDGSPPFQDTVMLRGSGALYYVVTPQGAYTFHPKSSGASDDSFQNYVLSFDGMMSKDPLRQAGVLGVDLTDAGGTHGFSFSAEPNASGIGSQAISSDWNNGQSTSVQNVFSREIQTMITQGRIGSTYTRSWKAYDRRYKEYLADKTACDGATPVVLPGWHGATVKCNWKSVPYPDSIYPPEQPPRRDQIVSLLQSCAKSSGATVDAVVSGFTVSGIEAQYTHRVSGPGGDKSGGSNNVKPAQGQ